MKDCNILILFFFFFVKKKQEKQKALDQFVDLFDKILI